MIFQNYLQIPKIKNNGTVLKLEQHNMKNFWMLPGTQKLDRVLNFFIFFYKPLKFFCFLIKQ